MNKKIANDLIKIYNKNPEAIQILFEYNLVNFPINIPDSNSNTILHSIVAKHDHKTLIAVLNYILYVNTDYTNLINHQNNDGDTAMHIAVRHGFMDCAKMLHKAGTNLTLINKKGESIELQDDSTQTIIDDDDDKIVSSIIDEGIRENNKISVFTTECDDIKSQIDSIFTKQEDSDTQVFLTNLLKKLNPLSRGGRKYTKRNRKKTPSNLAHEEVISKAKSELNMNDEDAAAFKSGLYKLVKKQFPTLSNKDRSLKMLELMKDKKIIKEIRSNLDEIKKVIAEHRKQKEQAK
jgi:hypothetical protein